MPPRWPRHRALVIASPGARDPGMPPLRHTCSMGCSAGKKSAPGTGVAAAREGGGRKLVVSGSSGLRYVGSFRSCGSAPPSGPPFAPARSARHCRTRLSIGPAETNLRSQPHRTPERPAFAPPAGQAPPARGRGVGRIPTSVLRGARRRLWKPPASTGPEGCRQWRHFATQFGRSKAPTNWRLENEQRRFPQ